MVPGNNGTQTQQLNFSNQSPNSQHKLVNNTLTTLQNCAVPIELDASSLQHSSLNNSGPTTPNSQAEEEPLYVNAKQYNRILKRRQARNKLENEGRIPKVRMVNTITFNFLIVLLTSEKSVQLTLEMVWLQFSLV